MHHFLLVTLTLLLATAYTQTQTNTKGFIQTRRLFVFDTIDPNQANQQGITVPFTFNRNFTEVPRVGLAVYTMDFEYSPEFSCQVASGTTVTSATLFVSTTKTGQNNQLYIMYIATDHDFLGVFMPGPLITFLLTIGQPGPLAQDFDFNFKEQISANSQLQNIRLSVYLTGISASSELVSNGYPTNHNYFAMAASIRSTSEYRISVSVQSDFGDITITQVEYTIIYFDVTLMSQFRYNMDRGVALLSNFGGTADTSSKSITLEPLTPDSDFENLEIFYGISAIECRQGQSITLSAVHQFYLNPNTNVTQVFLTMETWKLTLIQLARYNFVQYQSLRCDLPNSNCDSNCFASPLPHFVSNGVCEFCHSSCLSCNVTLSTLRCDTCHQTRVLSSSGLCACKTGYYDTQDSFECLSCFPCQTCTLRNVCQTCDSSLLLVLNPILSVCECAPGWTANYINPQNNTLSPTEPCTRCPQHCLYCQNSTFCLACDFVTYLNTTGSCVLVCDINQKFQNNTSTCSASNDATFEQDGRLGYSWDYTADQSLIEITLTFSQANTQFYYFQNGQGYSFANSGGASAGSQQNQIYFDDGTYSQGFSDGSAALAQQNALITMNSNAANIFGNSLFSDFEAQQNSQVGSISNLFGSVGGIDASMLNGSYYGLGQQQFFKYLYMDHAWRNNITPYFNDSNGIMYGKYNLSTNTPPSNPNFLDALANNLLIQVGGISLPYSISAISPNQFKLTATTPQSFNGEQGFVILKDQGLVRSGRTASQQGNVSNSMYVYACALPSEVSSAESIQDTTRIIVGVLWGIGKYPLFIGFGWVFMPLMLTLQHIMALNYMDTIMPLNLDRFLAAFADFRNPSIFYNPLRNEIDSDIFTHQEMYTVIPEFYEFDRGIDFMRNCFQFFFIPFLSMVLYGLIVGVNKIINVACNRDIPLISQYIQPRWALHIAAYTLVQALPVTFFFFAQLNDMRFSSPNQPNSSYPVFNIAMAFIALFLTCAIPLLLVVMIYSRYNSNQRRVNDALGFKELFLNLLESKPTRLNKARMDDPLWTCSPFYIISYGFCLAVFYLTILWGFFTSFFYDRFAWQITGLIVATAVFMAFAAVNDQFDSWLIKAFWIIFSLLLIAFLLLLAGIGSTITATPCDLQDLGYLGIGFIFALLLAALIASLYLLWLTLDSLYQTYFKHKKLLVPVEDIDESQIDEKPQRTKAFHSGTSRMKSTYMKNPIQSSAGLIGSRMNIGGSQNGLNGNSKAFIGSGGLIATGGTGAMAVGGDRRIENGGGGYTSTGDQIVIKEVQGEEETANLRDRLVFMEVDPRTGEYVFRTERSKQEYRFDGGFGGALREKEPLYIDNNNEIWDFNNLYLGNVGSLQNGGQGSDLIVRENNGHIPTKQISNTNIVIQDGVPSVKHTISDDLDIEPQSHRRMLVNEPQVQVNNIVHNVYVIDGEQYTKEGEDERGNFILRNNRTREAKVLPGRQFTRGGGYTIEEQDVPMMRHSERRQPVEIEMSNKGDRNIVNNASRGVEVQNAPSISREIHSNVVSLPKNRTFRHNGVDYMDMGEENGLFKLFNKTERSMKRVPLQEYIQMNSQGFANRVNINGVDYEVEGNGPNGTVTLFDSYTRQPRTVSAQEFQLIRRQNQEAFDRMMGRYQVPENIKSNIPNGYEGSNSNGNAANVLLLQSKADREDPTLIRGGNSRKTITEIEVVHSNYPPQQTEEDEDEETIEKVLQQSPGPFELFVIPGDKVTEIDDEDHYEKEDAMERLTMEGRNVLEFMQICQEKHPNAVIFMVDVSNQEEYRLN